MSEKVLLVEDDKTTSLLLQKNIEKLGYTILAALPTGEEAVKIIADSPPDLILMDINLKGKMDGIETAKLINETFSIPIIYITSTEDPETLERLKETNPYGYIIKPIDRKELRTSIDMALLRFNMEKTFKENEYKFSTILSSIGDAVIVADHTGKITYMNPVAEIMTGSDLGKASGKKIDAIIHIENETIESLKNNRPAFPIRESCGYNFLISANKHRVPIDYSISPQKDKKGTLIGTVIVIRDITERIKSEEQLQESFKQLRKAMGGIIQAMVQTVETKDPYTAGHQRRVADMARRIAEEMQLHHDKIEGIRTAGVIHDLGKISIPAEILSKPGKISEIEYSLIQGHVQIGYDILKTIDFPWPVADIVHQHHERIDGSGYPRGLTGDNILIESKIIAVADVVEAMGSHRPYRAALGIDIALAEIIKNRGKLYDIDVVDACVSIFKEKNYVMT